MSRLHFTALLLLIGALGGSGCSSRKDDKPLEGEWVVVQNLSDGKIAEPRDDEVILFQDNKMIALREGKVMEEMTFSLDATKAPRTIDITGKKGAMIGIYHAEGETLKLCLARVTEKGPPERPREFASLPGREHALLTLRRKAKAEVVEADGGKEPTLAEAVAHLSRRGGAFQREDFDQPPYALDLARIRDLKKEDLVYLKPLTSLKKLHLYHQDQVPAAALVPLGRLLNLTELNLVGMRVSGAGMSQIAKLTRLESLHLGNSDVTDADLANLQGLKTLKMLALYNTKVAGPGLAHLSELGNLQFLSLNMLKMDDAGLAHLPNLKGLTNLEVSETLITDRSIARFKQFPKLRGVRIERTQVSDAGRKQLESLYQTGAADFGGQKEEAATQPDAPAKEPQKQPDLGPPPPVPQEPVLKLPKAPTLTPKNAPNKKPG